MNRKKDVLLILIILSQTLVSIVIISVIQATDDISTVKEWLPYWEALIVALALLSIAAIANIYSNARESIKTSLMREHLRHNEMLLSILQSEKHEYRRHLQALQSLIYLDRTQEAQQYIDGIAENYWNKFDNVYIEHPELNSLVNSKFNLAKSQGIEFSLNSTCDFSLLKIEPWDLCSIIGNLLDNAIESALQDKRQPSVELEFEFQNKDFIICVRNNGATINGEDRDRIFEAGFTSKESVGRGYGLYIVRKLVKRYGGEIEVISDKRTAIIVKIPEGRNARELVQRC
ncbi:MAG: ATP-binding protein [Syntrophomonadaceae bacterium]